MDKTLTEFHIEIIESFKVMQAHTAGAVEAIYSDKLLRCELYEGGYEWSDSKDELIRLIKTIEYTDDLEPRGTIKQIGAVGCSEDTLVAVKGLNSAKNQFKSAIQSLKNANKNVKTKILMQKLDNFFEKELSEWSKLVKGAIKRTGYSRLNLKHCYRNIHLVEYHPKRITWGWNKKARSLKKITIAQAQQMLLEKGGDIGIDVQLKKLARLSSGTPLAVVQDLAALLNVNIIPYSEDEYVIKTVRTALPIFYLIDPLRPRVIVKPPQKAASEKAEERVDKIIESEVFLPAIRAHLYKDQTRV
jgi:hypothetical protein